VAGAAGFDDAGGEQLVEPVRHEGRQQSGELVGGGGGAGLVEVDELVGFEAEHFAEVGAVAPGPDEVADSGEGVAAVLQPADQLEAGEVCSPVDADPPTAFGRGEEPHGLVFADRAHREPGTGGELVDSQLEAVAPRGGGDIHGQTVTANTVTVNTVNNRAAGAGPRVEDDLLEVLREATSTPTLAFDGPPGRLTGAFWAELVVFRLRGAPCGWQGDLVARVMPDRRIGAKETTIQTEVAAQGFPTPSVHLAGGPEDGLGRAFMVMNLATGVPLLGGLGGLGAMAALPRLARRLHDVLGESMARLHRLDPTPVRARLVDADVGGLGVAALLSGFTEAAGRCDRADLVAAARWLEEHPPAPSPEVICHGDLHPFNLLVDTDGEVTVLDWSASLLAPGAYDLAFTGLVLAEPPVAVPRVFRPMVRAAGRWLGHRFRRAYSRHAAIDVDPQVLGWCEGVVCLRALVEVAGWVAAGQVEDRRGHPWLVSGPGFAVRLSMLTVASVTSR
jgi:aminoglycoside phosphotransferase (APT) family kinase protein